MTTIATLKKMETTALATVISDIDTFWVSQEGKRRKPIQLERYTAKRAPENIKRFIAIGGGPKMGTTLEQFARHRFHQLSERKHGKGETGYDHIIRVGGKDMFVEQKSSGHWGDSDFCWQHVEVLHKWNMLLLCGIGYTEIHFWALGRTTFNELVTERKIMHQGNKAGESSEGMWFHYSAVKDSLVPIRTAEELAGFAVTVAG